MKTLKDIIDFNEKNREKEMPYFGQDTFIKAEEKGPLTTQEYLDALLKTINWREKRELTPPWTRIIWTR